MITKIDLLNAVLEPKSHDSKTVKTQARFYIPLKPELMIEVLRDSYSDEVRKRGYEPSFSDAVEKRLTATAEWLTNPNRKPWLLLYGEQPGTGKTTIAKAIHISMRHLYSIMEQAYNEACRSIHQASREEMANLVPDHLKGEYLSDLRDWHYEREHPDINAKIDLIIQRSADDECRCHKTLEQFGWLRFINVDFRTAQDIADGAATGGNEWVESQVVESRFIFIDDLGAEPLAVKNYGIEILPLVRSLTSRYEYRRPTIITSNLSDKGISEKYGPRIADRINEVADKIHFTGKSFRG